MEKEIIQSMLERHLSGFSDIKINEKLKTIKFDEDVLKEDLYFLKSTRCNEITVSSYEIIKLILAHKYLRNNSSTYFVGTGKDIFDIYMSDGVEEQIFLQNTETLIVQIGKDFKNNYMQEILPSLLMSRKNQSIIVWDNKLVSDSVGRRKIIIDKYGEDFYKFVTTCNKTKCENERMKLFKDKK